MRTKILFYYFALYVTKNITIVETTQAAFMEWLRDCGEEDLIGDQQPIFRHFQSLVNMGYLDKTGLKTGDGFNIYRINRPENFEDLGMMSDSDMLLRVFFASMLENMDYQQMPAAERSLLQRSITEPRGSRDGERILQISEILRWSEHPATDLISKNLNHLDVLSGATRAVGRYGQQGIARCEVDFFSAPGQIQTWEVYPLEVQVRGDQVLLYSVTSEQSGVVWIPLRFVEDVRQVTDQPVLNIRCETYVDAFSFAQLLHPDVLSPYLLEDLRDGYTIHLQFDEQGWAQLHSGHIPADADIKAEVRQLELLHPLTPSLARWVMQFGRHVQVIEPGRLSDLIREEMLLMFSET